MTLTIDQRAQMVHALGLTPRRRGRKFGRRWAYRNYFYAGTVDVPIWRHLVELGFAKEVKQSSPRSMTISFCVTKEGVEAIGAEKYIPKHFWQYDLFTIK